MKVTLADGRTAKVLVTESIATPNEVLAMQSYVSRIVKERVDACHIDLDVAHHNLTKRFMNGVDYVAAYSDEINALPKRERERERITEMRTMQIKKKDARNFNDYVIAVSSTAFVAAEAFSLRKFYYASSYGWRAEFIDTSVNEVSFTWGYERFGNIDADAEFERALLAVKEISDYATAGPVSRAAYETAIYEFIKRIKGKAK